MAIIAIVAALAVLGIVMVMVAVTIPLHQQAEASCLLGYIHSGNKSAIFTALEKSEGRCF